MCYTADADDLYGRLINTEAFVVPANDPERLKVWPSLESKEVTVTGVDRNESVADVVLSSIGKFRSNLAGNAEANRVSIYVCTIL